MTSSLIAAKSANGRKDPPSNLVMRSATPLSIEEEIPWKCRQLIIGTGAYGRLPVMNEVKHEAERRKVDLVVLPTSQAIDVLNKNPKATNAILHVTC
jgi:hypothetical protein